MRLGYGLPVCRKLSFGDILPLLLILYSSCSQDRTGTQDSLFKSIPAIQSGITFENTLTETDTFNYFLYSYIYMGGGVTAGDFNSDGLTDLYFVGNMEPNHLYLNQGDFRFEEVGEPSRTDGDERWMLGSTLCDINNDGLQDLYVSASGLKGNRENLLYVNQGLNGEGIPVFTEEAGKYGIADPGLSTQSVFFDYDNDGDLDLYVANYPITQFKAPPFFYRQMMRNVGWIDSDHLYRNNGDGSFTDVTREAGLLSFGLSLSATISDLNLDGYKDIYISNDFISPDFFFINNGDGTFTDRTREVTGQTSFYGMGADIADYNNDGFPDIMQIDMAPENHQRNQENMTRMRVEDFEEMLHEGLHYQYRYSTLYLNRGVMKHGLPYFSNAAWIAGVTSTDWSWAALFADFNLDGWKDLYITNGSRRDINNIDYFNQMQKTVYFDTGLDETEYLDQVQNMPSLALPNYMFRNNGDLTFTRMDRQWGMPEASFSNGVTYADLDNDGDLELIVNNIDQPALVYRNYACEHALGNFLKIEFKGPASNRMGIGSMVQIWHQEGMQSAEMTLSRGYESSVEPVLYFGAGNHSRIDSLVVTWADGEVQTLKDVSVNQKLTVIHEEAGSRSSSRREEQKLFTEITGQSGPDFVHSENHFDDLRNQVLLPHMLSRLGPGIAAGDVDGDGLTDCFIGNAAGSRGTLFIQEENHSFSVLEGPWSNDASNEDMGSAFFDADNDGDLDLYVVSGGNEFPEGSEYYLDRLYINHGNRTFSRDSTALQDIRISGSVVEVLDFDLDGDLDLFAGGRHIPGKYPLPASSLLLENRSSNGVVRFEDVTPDKAPFLQEWGLVTTAFSEDLDNDGWPDLVVGGEWMPICVLKNTGGAFEQITMEGTTGWWFCLEGADFDQDGDVDLVAGNLGLNARYSAQSESQVELFADDFDKNGSYDIVFSYVQNGNQYPLRGRDCFVAQNPAIALKFPTYASFGAATVEDIYSKKAIRKSLHLQAKTFASCYLQNRGDGLFDVQLLPNEAQLSPINDILIQDFDGDGKLDFLAAGNMFSVEVVTPRFDAGVGVFLKGDGNGAFEVSPATASGFFAPGDGKSLCMLTLGRNKENIILVGNNNGVLQLFNWIR
jgi:hypothetical protein